MRTAEIPRRWAWPGLAAVLAIGAGLRVWGIAQGLPFAYNADEDDHFVRRAVEMFGHDLNPHYFANPPAYTYVLHFLFGAWYGANDIIRFHQPQCTTTSSPTLTFFTSLPIFQMTPLASEPPM